MPGTSKKRSDALQAPFKQYGQSGAWVSDWYPNIANYVDDLAIIRSCWTDALTISACDRDEQRARF